VQIGKGKQGVKIGEYGTTKDGNAIIGWVEPACDSPRWILWFTRRGDAILYAKRKSDGGVIGEPIKISAQ
jgi:hypothetical protein